jgi:hypothetical protein
MDFAKKVLPPVSLPYSGAGMVTGREKSPSGRDFSLPAMDRAQFL